MPRPPPLGLNQTNIKQADNGWKVIPVKGKNGKKANPVQGGTDSPVSPKKAKGRGKGGKLTPSQSQTGPQLVLGKEQLRKCQSFDATSSASTPNNPSCVSDSAYTRSSNRGAEYSFTDGTLRIRASGKELQVGEFGTTVREEGLHSVPSDGSIQSPHGDSPGSPTEYSQGARTIADQLRQIAGRCSGDCSQPGGCGCEECDGIGSSQPEPPVLGREPAPEAPVDPSKLVVTAGGVSLNLSTYPARITSGSHRPQPQDFVRVGSLGQGAGGTVYIANYRPKGKAHPTSEMFAQKVIELPTPDDELSANRIARAMYSELMAVKIAMHPKYIVQSYEAFMQENSITILMEFMEIGSLSRVLSTYSDDNRLPSSVIAAVAFQVLNGLDYLHTSGRGKRVWIHRDLKPDNILISKGGEVKISDFGSSAILSCSTDSKCSYPGTEAYKSPEYWGSQDGPPSITTKTDIWGLGITLVECALGSFPWPSTPWTRTFQEMDRIRKAGRFSPAEDDRRMGRWEKLKERSPKLTSFLEACLTVDPKERPDARTLLQHPFITESCVFNSSRDRRSQPAAPGDGQIGASFSAPEPTPEKDADGAGPKRSGHSCKAPHQPPTADKPQKERTQQHQTLSDGGGSGCGVRIDPGGGPLALTAGSGEESSPDTPTSSSPSPQKTAGKPPSATGPSPLMRTLSTASEEPQTPTTPSNDTPPDGTGVSADPHTRSKKVISQWLRPKVKAYQEERRRNRDVAKGRS